jgi:uncharacterized protein (DUF1501 family)
VVPRHLGLDELRPSLRLHRGALPAHPGGQFAFHPALAPLIPWYRRGRLAVIHGVGNPEPAHSHTEAQRFADTLSGADQPDGWLTRTHRALLNEAGTPRAVAASRGAARALAGEVPSPGRAATFAEQLGHLADLVGRSPAPVLAAVELPGWDTHLQQGSGRGPLAHAAAQLAGGLAGFARDLGPHLERVTVVAYSEFGRSIRQNAGGGTDHGQGGVLLVLGGAIRGGRILSPFHDTHCTTPAAVGLPAAIDLRLAVGELLAARLGQSVADAVLPGYRQYGPLLHIA